MRTLWILAALGLLTACGVDGAPSPPPADDRPEPGISASGTASAGVKARF